MDQIGSKIKQISSELKDYVETRIDLFTLNVGEQISHWIGISTQKIVGFIILGVGFFFGFMGLAIYLGELFGNEALGYAAISGFLLLLGLIFSISKPFGISSSVQKQIMKGVLKTIEDKSSEKKLELPAAKEKGKEHE